jgi:hypothetical protein
MIRVVHPGSGLLSFYPSRIQGSKRHRIPDPDPKHWFIPPHSVLLKNINGLDFKIWMFSVESLRHFDEPGNSHGGEDRNVGSFSKIVLKKFRFFKFLV